MWCKPGSKSDSPSTTGEANNTLGIAITMCIMGGSVMSICSSHGSVYMALQMLHN